MHGFDVVLTCFDQRGLVRCHVKSRIDSDFMWRARGCKSVPALSHGLAWPGRR